MIRTTTAIAAAAALCAPAFAQDVTVHFWDNQQTESGLSQFQQAAVDRFEAENPNIKIEVTTIPYPEYQQRLLTAVRGGNAPDVATLDQIWVAAFAEAYAVEDLSSMARNSGMRASQFFPGAWESANYDGKLYGIPFNVDVWQFSFYNRSMLRAKGVDPATIHTFEGLKRAGQLLTGDGKYGIGLFAHRGEDTVVVLNSFIFSNGGKILNNDGSCALDQAPSVEALEYLQDLAEYAPSGILNHSSGDMRELFLNETLAIEFWPALEQPTLQKSDIDWGFVNGTAPAGRTAIGTFGGWNLALFSASRNKEEAWKFIEFMVREDVNGDVVDLIPANVRAADAFLRENRDGPDDILSHLANASPRPLSPQYLEVADIQMTMAQDLFSGMGAQEAADKACSAINAL